MGYATEQKTEKTPDPILSLRHAKLEALKIRESEVTERDGKVFAPKVSILWKIVDDNASGEHNGIEFWDNYSLVKSYDDDTKYVIRDGTRIGDLAAFVAHAFYGGKSFFDVDVDFAVLEGAEVTASLEPRRFKPGEPATGTRTNGATLMPTNSAQRVAPPQPVPQAAQQAEPETDESDFDDISF